MTDLILAILHHLLAFALLAILVAEMVIVRPGLAGADLSKLKILDRWYGISAGLILIIGALRVAYGIKGPDFYLPNPGLLGEDGCLSRGRATLDPANNQDHRLGPQAPRPTPILRSPRTKQPGSADGKCAS